MGRPAFRPPLSGRQALANLRRRLNDPSAAASTADALESLDCELFLREYEAEHAALRQDPEEWAQVQAERAAYDGSLLDGLEADESA